MWTHPLQVTCSALARRRWPLSGYIPDIKMYLPDTFRADTLFRDTESDSDCVARWSNVSTAWLLDTWPSSAGAGLSPASTDTGIYDLLDVLRVRHAFCKAELCAGTLFLSVSRTMHCPMSNFRHQLKHFYFYILLAH